MNPDPKPAATDTLDAAAAQWLARRDRGLTPAEQDSYLQWLSQDPRHGPAIARQEKSWQALDALTHWRPEHSSTPNPDLLAPHRPARIYWLSTALAAAAAVVLSFYLWSASPFGAARPHHEAIIHPGPERQTLADGSVVELNQGAQIEVRFTPGERHVRLVSGEAFFTVAKNAARPFFVDTDKVSVRAVGTAFSVSLTKSEVAVLVTEGRVQVLEHRLTSETPAVVAPKVSVQEPVFLSGGQRAAIDLAPLAPTVVVAPVVQDLTPAAIDRALSWQGLRLEFVNMPLGDVVAEFNRYNRHKLVVGDTEAAAILVGGNFRADNAAGFVRLLEAGFGIAAEPDGDNVTRLRRAR